MTAINESIFILVAIIGATWCTIVLIRIAVFSRMGGHIDKKRLLNNFWFEKWLRIVSLKSGCAESFLKTVCESLF